MKQTWTFTNELGEVTTFNSRKSMSNVIRSKYEKRYGKGITLKKTNVKNQYDVLISSLEFFVGIATKKVYGNN